MLSIIINYYYYLISKLNVLKVLVNFITAATLQLFYHMITEGITFNYLRIILF